MPFGEDDRPFWQRLYGVGTRWNPRAVDNFGRFFIGVLLTMAALFALLLIAIWLTG